MTEELKAALTPEEWKRVPLSDDGTFVERQTDGVGAHALAALCLYGQPFGFTHEDAKLADFAARAFERIGSELGLPFPAEDAANLRSLAARIAALLPPNP